MSPRWPAPPGVLQRYTKSDIHWQLIDRLRVPESDGARQHAIECCCNQALFCPYYAALEGGLGADWGVILNPESSRFGLLTFEHDPCGCPRGEDGHPLHPSGQQKVDEWVAPGCKQSHQFRVGGYASCVREKNHRGTHRDHQGRTWR